jgi:hypothetical protein
MDLLCESPQLQTVMHAAREAWASLCELSIEQLVGEVANNPTLFAMHY